MNARILAENYGQLYEKVMKNFDMNYWMDDKESIEYGIVHGMPDKI